jgi:tetratricopeptide (TPR) repeat protein
VTVPQSPADIARQYKDALAKQQAGDSDGALEIYTRILFLGPRPAEVLFQMARIRAARGELEAAKDALKEALEAKPKEPAIWQALHQLLTNGARLKLERQAGRAGIRLGSTQEVAPILEMVRHGQPEDALKQAMKLARAAPMAAPPVHAVGVAEAALGQWAKALSAFEEAARRDPKNAVYLRDLGRALVQTGRPEAGLARLDEAKSLGVDVALQVARALSDTCRDDEAASVLEAAVPPLPQQGADAAIAALSRKLSKSAEPHEHLSLLALTKAALRDVAGARAAFELAVKTSKSAKRAGPLRQSLAAALADAGEHQAAIDVLTEANGDPSAAILTQRGQIRQTVGALAGAEADLTRAIELEPLAAEAYRAYANGRKTGADDLVAARLEGQLSRADLPGPTRRVMRFAAAKFAADRGDVTAEIDHLDRANRLMADAYPYSFDTDLAIARELAGDWPALEGMAAGGPDDPVLFVTGLPRSGTTLAETILAAHPEVTAGGEMPYLSRALAPALEALRGGEADADRFAAAGARYLAAARRRTGAPLVIADKAISTFSRIGHAAAALPGARFVILRRDPRDTGLSLWRNMFPEGLHRYAYDQVQMARYIRLHEALVAFWAARLPGRVHVLDYEALTAQPEPVIRDLVAFAGLPWDDACLAPHQASRSVATLSFAQVRQPIGRGSVAGWQRFEAGLGDLLAELERTVPPEL